MDFYITVKEVADRICKIVNTAVDLEVGELKWSHTFGAGTLSRRDKTFNLTILLNIIRLTQDGTPPYEVATTVMSALQNRYNVESCNYTNSQVSVRFNKR